MTERSRASNLDIVLALAVAAVSAFAASAFFVPYQVHGHSSMIDLARQIVLDSGIRSGIPYPRWAPFTYFGYGSPLFSFYAPFGYYVAEVFVLTGASVVNGIRIAYILAIMGAGIGMFLYGREIGGAWAGAAAGSLYVLTPYLLCDMYVRAALAELMVAALAPLVLFLLEVYGRTGRWRVLAASSAGFGLIVLSHNIGALMYAALVPVYCLISLRGQRRWTAVLTVPAGLVLSMFFWLPAFVQRGDIHAEQSLTGGYFSFADHFLYPAQLFVHRWGFGSSVPGPDDNLPLMIGLVHVGAFGLFLAGCYFARGVERRDAALVLALSLAVFLVLPWSGFVWNHVPLLRFFQFPWRFLTVAALASSALAAAAVRLLARRFGSAAAALAATSLALAAVVVYGPHVEAQFALWNKETQTVERTDRDTVEPALASGRFARMEELLDSPAHMVQLGVKATSEDDYLPRWVLNKPQRPPADRFLVMKGNAAILDSRSDFARHSAVVESQDEARLTAEVFYFPGWTAAVDSNPVPIEPNPNSGTISLDVPRGRHSVELSYSGTPLQKTTAVISAGGWTALLLVPFLTRTKRERSGTGKAGGRARRRKGTRGAAGA